MSLITIIGRGHGGTRPISHTLSASGVYMGEPLNASGDLLPPQAMYAACRLLARHVHWVDGLTWDFGALHTLPIPAEFTALIHHYLTTVLQSDADHSGWKIPETTLVFPWIVRLFPDIKYIHWVRNPRDNILAGHLTDDLRDFGVAYPDVDALLARRYPAQLQQARIATELLTQRAQLATTRTPIDELRLRARRAISWQYQYEIVKATPKPRHWLRVRFEDFIQDQAATLARLEQFLGVPLARIPIRNDTVGRYAAAEGVTYFDFLDAGMQEFGYEIPAVNGNKASDMLTARPAPTVQTDHPRGENHPMAERQPQTQRRTRSTVRRRRPNIVLLAIDSLRADHLSSYGYPRPTTLHLDHFALGGALFERTYSPSIPTTPAYASMLSGRDCFGTQVVALRHQGPLRAEVPTLPEILRAQGYDTTCVGFSGNPSSRGFDKRWRS